MKKIYQRLSQSAMLLSSMALFSVGQVSQGQAQIAPALKINYINTSLSQSSCVNRALSLLRGASSATNVQVYGGYIVGAYAGTTTVTISCVTSNRIVFFNAAGVDHQNTIDWVDWMRNNF